MSEDNSNKSEDPNKKEIFNRFPQILRFKWNHYFFEFLMVSLAVFCGFLAENYRESRADRKQEIKYMTSLIEDLKVDTAAIRTTIENIDGAIVRIDTMLFLIKQIPKMDSLGGEFFRLNNLAVPYLTFKPIDRTASQLKNGANMNLIEDIKISNAMMDYWMLGEISMDRQERFNVYRLKSREIGFTMFKLYEFHLTDKPVSKRKMAVVKNALSGLTEFGNYLASCQTIMRGYKERLEIQRDEAVSLINNISKAYSE